MSTPRYWHALCTTASEGTRDCVHEANRRSPPRVPNPPPRLFCAGWPRERSCRGTSQKHQAVDRLVSRKAARSDDCPAPADWRFFFEKHYGYGPRTVPLELLRHAGGGNEHRRV